MKGEERTPETPGNTQILDQAAVKLAAVVIGQAPSMEAVAEMLWQVLSIEQINELIIRLSERVPRK